MHIKLHACLINAILDDYFTILLMFQSMKTLPLTAGILSVHNTCISKTNILPFAIKKNHDSRCSCKFNSTLTVALTVNYKYLTCQSQKNIKTGN